MAAANAIEIVLSNQEFPIELLPLSNAHDADEPRVASMLSGMVAARQQDEVICPLMVKRNLLVPGHQGPISRDGWQVE